MSWQRNTGNFSFFIRSVCPSHLSALLSGFHLTDDLTFIILGFTCCCLMTASYIIEFSCSYFTQVFGHWLLFTSNTSDICSCALKYIQLVFYSARFHVTFFFLVCSSCHTDFVLNISKLFIIRSKNINESPFLMTPAVSKPTSSCAHP